ncbi:ATP-binding cassette domain-containing protein [Niveispirillum sp. SYP-B3756]|uniref:ABC-F family ATP-binding cassette domain-containing protein n=1 Tax=Niveispirillum sp. SYP-B3756 TaxID=2662178 RepID=UPI001290D9FA|nr:ATP-binding cassette domain-containing protein [Niveispirillum sp. SYP-B3756]MQP66058.1 ATP-binding cassette domain-containing protein [Niveispirillum sp. SYP-B3756]
MAPNNPALVGLAGASVHMGATVLFENIDVAVSRGEKICLVGRNGSGKSTLMKALAGIIDVDKGERFIQPGARVAHLAQEPDFTGFATVAEFVAGGQDEPALYRVEAVLEALDLPGDRACATLSGGESRRAALARALVDQPDVLLLDEPTNHLDIPTILWLEKELQQFRGALLLISHDRAFLANLSKRILWLDRGVLRTTEQSFSQFETWRDEIYREEEATYHKLDRKIQAELKWMWEGGISGRRTRNMGRVRRLQGMRQERADRIKSRQVNLGIAEGDVSGKLVIEAEAISKSFHGSAGERVICRDFSTRIQRGDKVGLIGPNGAGKSTILKMLIGELTPDNGNVKLGTNLQTIVFDQRRAQLDPNATLKQVLLPEGGDNIWVGGKPRHIASYMKDFLFDPSMMDQPVRVMSGGERNRLLLAKLFAQPSNLMVLDEPTNDLDMDTLDLLEEVLADYDGTLLLVSHDRDFLDRLVTSTIAVEGDGNVAEYAGGYSDYLIQRKENEPEAAKPTASKPSAPSQAAAPKAKKKLSFKENRELEELPGRIDALEKKIKQLATKLADPAFYGKDAKGFAKATDDIGTAQAELAAAEERWLELEALREELEG